MAAEEKERQQRLAIEERQRQEREREKRRREAIEAQRRAEETAAAERAHARAIARNRDRFGPDPALRRRFRRAHRTALTSPAVPLLVGVLTLAGGLAAGFFQLETDWLKLWAEETFVVRDHRDIVAWPLGALAGASVSLLLGMADLMLKARSRRAARRAARIAGRIGCGQPGCRECEVPAAPRTLPKGSSRKAVSAQIKVGILAGAIVVFLALGPGAELR